ncbi:MAG: colanic acid biosynthesis glycosyltransferase WcaL, partial [Cyanobacteria bacterium REEB65]|nr:colanic acid biosynthesis glycosyltransferase WcaL [Cyanobacteria bacterium REEB65]
MPVVLHSRRVWLPLTETWLFTQIRNLPPSVENHVVCEAVDNLAAFGTIAVHCAGGSWQSNAAKAL